jgi:hypothetical protein
MHRPLLLLIIAAGVLGACKDNPTGPAPPNRIYQVGEHYEFNVNSDSACEDPDFRTGRVVAITDKAIVVADTANPRGQGTFTDQAYADFGTAFDEIVWPSNTQNFGMPHDVDGNGRVILFFTRAVNELTPRGQSWYVGGFFHSRDLFPKRETRDFRGCEASNEAEILYMLVPDPQGLVNGNPRTIANELRGTVPVLAHELQHLINASRRLFVVKAGGTGWQEDTWLNEGLSHIAEELLGYWTSPLAPRQNIDADRLSSSLPEREAFLRFQHPNANRYAAYLEDPEAHTLIGPDSLATRGATWSFLRYAADRKGGDESAVWRNLVTTSSSGLTNLQSVLGVEPIDWIHDWVVSIAADDNAGGLATQFRQASWNFRSIYPWVRDSAGRPLYGRYPLRAHPLTNNAQQQIGISGASAAFLTFGVLPGSVAELRMGGDASGCTPGSTISLAVGQTHTLASDGTATLCVNGGSGGGDFVLIPFSNSTGPGKSNFSIRASSVAAASASFAGPEGYAPGVAALRPFERQAADAEASGRWKSELRAREATELGPLIRSAGAASPTPPIASTSGTYSTPFRITLVRLH